MKFKSERRSNKKGNRKFVPVGANAAQFKRSEVNKNYLGTRIKSHLKSKSRNSKNGSFSKVSEVYSLVLENTSQCCGV